MSEILLPAATSTLKGFFKLTAIRPDGRERPLTGWFPNLITDVGLNSIGTRDYMQCCHVGTNNTAPSVNDTILGGFVAGTGYIFSSSSGVQSSPPYYGWLTRTYRFNQGAAAGNLSEVGIATAATNGGSTILFSRALILDELGDPTSITVLPDEVLDVTYQIRLYPPLVDDVSVITITGSGNHTVTTRAATVTGIIWCNRLPGVASFTPGGSGGMSVYNGPIGTILQLPSGNSAGGGFSNLAYGNNNLYRDGLCSFGLTSGNVAGGIRSASWFNSLGMFQCEFDPVIPKTSTKTMTLTVRMSWARNV